MIIHSSLLVYSKQYFINKKNIYIILFNFNNFNLKIKKNKNNSFYNNNNKNNYHHPQKKGKNKMENN